MAKGVLFLAIMMLVPTLANRGISKLTYGAFTMENLKVGAYGSGYHKNLVKKIMAASMVICALTTMFLLNR
ncbi:hypothetical protein [Alkaliphilus sp. B6464]|uniref:hypothetical protein n=1 Tax=Alkaliphilus sp. B6464 TaxID=2731219 RepID=UPI001BA86C49|nr:hypothetical protein [Alkaliphilus sp. B6464]QUH22017.1 hypothetical protein HYG84_19115 [Alkaliphilus sp. B6464]